MIPILILAAGASRRMRGGDKLCEPVDGVALLSRQITAAQSVSDAVYVALPNAPHPRYSLIGSATPIAVPDAATGLSASLKTGVAALPDDTPAVVILLADLPEITACDLQTVIEARQNHPNMKIWRATSATGQSGHPILFDAATFPAFATLTGDTGAQPIIAANKAKLHLVALPHAHATTDLDTPEEWQAWRARTGR